MSIKRLLFGVTTALFAVLLNLNAVYAGEDHKAEALKHVQAAIDTGKAGDAKAATEHLEQAKTHAAAANKEKPSVHLDAAIQSLDKGIEHGKMGHGGMTVQPAEEAMTHIKAAN